MGADSSQFAAGPGLARVEVRGVMSRTGYMGSEDGEDPDLTHRDENSKGAAPRRSLPEADSIGIESFVRGLRLKTCTCCLRSFSERVAVRIVDVLESAVGPGEEAPTIDVDLV